MSTVKVVNVQHPSASTAAVTLAADGSMTGAFPAPNRNLLYNGAMQVAQRGTSTAGLAAGGSYSTADRWSTYLDTAGTWTQSIEADGPTGSGFTKSLKMLCTTANASLSAASLGQIRQSFEGQDLQRVAKGTAGAQELTLSFWVKSNVTGTYIVYMYDFDNNRDVSAAYTVNASATWEQKSVTFPADTTGAWDNDNASSVQVAFALAAGSDYTSGTLNTAWASQVAANRLVGQTNLAAAVNNYWQITGVQLETGPVATGFEFKSFGRELAECQRYYYRHTSGSVDAYAPIGLGAMYTATHVSSLVCFPTTMRGIPVLDASSGTNVYEFRRQDAADTFNSLTIDTPTTTCAVVYNNGQISGTAGDAGWIRLANQSTAYVAFSAEL